MSYELIYGVDSEIPEFDAFMDDLMAVCQKHGVGFDKKYGRMDESDSIVLVPYDKARWDFFKFEDSTVPFIQAARQAAEYVRDAKAREATAARAEEIAELRAAREAELKANGMRLSDGVYRLVRDAEQP